ncbi:hypothetical protein D3C80_2092000 [compost metagenome]
MVTRTWSTPTAATTTFVVVNPETTGVPVWLGTPYTATFFVWVCSVLLRATMPSVEFQA